MASKDVADSVPSSGEERYRQKQQHANSQDEERQCGERAALRRPDDCSRCRGADHCGDGVAAVGSSLRETTEYVKFIVFLESFDFVMQLPAARAGERFGNCDE
jgi:hypothetical protein